jgi:hypothetical protein
MGKRPKAAAVFVFGFILAGSPPEGAACGYHDNVSLARGVDMVAGQCGAALRG